jgi:hypothetical protein
MAIIKKREEVEMDEFFRSALGLFIIGLVACILGGSILPLLVVVAVIWTVAHFFGGFSGGGKR